MTPEERLETIGEFVQRSDVEFENGGNSLVAAELLWGAMAHGLIAVAEIRGWRCEGHRGYQEVAKLLEEAETLKRWQQDVGAGNQLHRHFYQGNLKPGELHSRRSAAKFAIARLIPIISA